MLDCAVDEREQDHTVNVILIFDDGSELDSDTLEDMKKLNASKRRRRRSESLSFTVNLCWLL
jgi:hypothetical protein